MMTHFVLVSMHCLVVGRDSVRVGGDGGDGGEAPDEAVVRDRGDGAADRLKGDSIDILVTKVI